MICCLSIAGSDSGGNAGVQADLRAFHAYGLHGCTVFTALTAQNPRGVSAVLSVPPDFITAQLDAVLGVYDIQGLKTGMLPGPDAIETVADRLSHHPGIAKVVDPVMIATSGARLASGDSIDAMKKHLAPLATLLTPNYPEALALCGLESSATPPDAEELAKRIYGLFGAPVLVKGGHLAGKDATDVLFDGKDILRFSLPWIENPVSTHGTGCSLAAALAAELALGRGLADAVAGAKKYVHDAVASSFSVGEDCGVLGFAQREKSIR